MQDAATVSAFNGAFISDSFGRFMKIAVLIGSAVTLMISGDFLKATGSQQFEFPILVALSTLGMLLMISAGDLIALYLGLELSSLALYVVASFNRDSVKSTEAGLKYFVLGALSSGMLLYGASLVYGMTGSVSFSGIASVLKDGTSLGVIFGLVFILAGLAFKISAVPFHMWTPDVYEGAPTPVTAFFAAAPKIAAMALLVRVVEQAFPHITGQWQQIIVFIAIASMGLGAFAAIGQQNIKRLLAYSSIGHVGFALVGLSAGTAGGVEGVAIYMAIYLVTTLGTFGCVLAMRREGGYVEDIDDLAGLSKTHPMMAFILAMLMFSLAGIPPLAGFFAKWYVFVAAVEAKLYALAVIGVVTSVVGAYYYLRIVKIMYFDEAKAPFLPMSAAIRLVVGVSGVFVLAFWLYPAPLVTRAVAAAQSLF
jgi:NADH-quinone oxidoreductase subunit N